MCHCIYYIQGFYKDIDKFAEERNNNKNNQSKPDILPSIRKPMTMKDSSKDKTQSHEKRIRSCDYAQWDKYDADTELTKLDLHEEKNREATEVLNNKKAKEYRHLDEAVKKAADELAKNVTRMSLVEREKIANNFRIQGNELFKAGDFEEAVLDYTRSLTMLKTPAAFSNRAMACMFCVV